jgi:hypothetical protein
MDVGSRNESQEPIYLPAGKMSHCDVDVV